jgi:cytochrome c-type biogenesis protein CcmH
VSSVPPLALLGGGFALWFYNRRRTQVAVAVGEAASFRLTPEEEARLAKLIADEEQAGKPG